MIETTVLLASVVVLAMAVASALIVLMRPWLARYAIARVNVRSSHRVPTPQGGGGAVVVATLAVAWAAIAWSSTGAPGIGPFLAVTAATMLLAAVGAIDDLRPLPAAVRLLIQGAAVAGVIAFLPEEWRMLPPLPWWLERTLLLLGGVWFVNLVNFMDGLDWMTVAEVVPVTTALALLGLVGGQERLPTIVAAALLGATLGFAPFNKPPARLFLGDVGSLPMGLLLGWLLLQLAQHGHLAAALILPLYYLADATLTLIRRLTRGERIWEAHRTHFYQRATDNGFSVPAVIGSVLFTNLMLAALALATVAAGNVMVSAAALLLASALVAWLLRRLARPRR